MPIHPYIPSHSAAPWKEAKAALYLRCQSYITRGYARKCQRGARWRRRSRGEFILGIVGVVTTCRGSVAGRAVSCLHAKMKGRRRVGSRCVRRIRLESLLRRSRTLPVNPPTPFSVLVPRPASKSTKLSAPPIASHTLFLSQRHDATQNIHPTLVPPLHSLHYHAIRNSHRRVSRGISSPEESHLAPRPHLEIPILPLDRKKSQSRLLDAKKPRTQAESVGSSSTDMG